MRYTVFNLSHCRFPRGRAPLLARLNPRLFRGERGSYDSIFLSPATRHYRLGRYALHAAMALAGLGPDTAILVPAYHCRTILDPAISLGAEAVLYPLTPSLEPDYAELERRLAARPSDAPALRALVLVHYFGWPQDMARARAWCDQRGLRLIEDCSHLIWGPKGGVLPGSLADYAAASPYKLAPGDECGALVTPTGQLPAVPRPLSLRQELSALWLTVDKALLRWRRRLRPADVAALPEQVRGLRLRNLVCGFDETVEEAGPSPFYQREHEGLAGPRWSRYTFSLAPFERIARARRTRYRQWLAGLRDTPHCRPLFPTLPEGVTPAFFPLLIDQPESHFYQLKRLGVPIWRWDDLAAGACPVSDDYRLHLLHLPCHQDVSETEMDWLLGAVNTVMHSKPRPLPALSEWLIHPLTQAPAQWQREWDVLNAALHDGHPMLDSRFIQALLRHFGEEGVTLCRHLHRGRTDGLALLYPHRRGMWTTFLPSQSQIGPLLMTDWTRLPALMRALPGYPLSLDMLSLDPDFTSPPSDLEGVGEPTVLDHALTMNIVLTGSFEDYWEGRSRKLIQNLRRYARRWEAEGLETQLRRLTRPEDMEAAVRRYGDLESTGWKGKEGTAIHADNVQGRFYTEVMQAFARSGQAVVYEYWRGERLAAARLALTSKRMILMLKTAYDESLADLAPGRLLLHDLTRLEFEQSQGKVIEFYTNATQDQLAWATGQRVIRHVTVYRHAAACRLVGLIRRAKLWVRGRPDANAGSE